MPGTFTYDEATNTIEVTDGTSGAPATFNDMLLADRASSAELLPAESCTTGHVLTYQVRPVEFSALQISFVIAGSSAGAGDTLDIIGTDWRGTAQVESIDVSGGDDTYTGSKYWQTIVNIDCTGWADGTLQVIQPIWGVIGISLGDELITNGGFVGGTGWTVEATWTIAGGVANGNGAIGTTEEIKQSSIDVVVGNLYSVRYTIAGIGGGESLQTRGGLTGTVRFADGTFTEYILAIVSGLSFRPHAVNGFSGTLDNVSVCEVLPQWTIHCNVDFGDGSTATHFTSLKEQVYFVDGMEIAIDTVAVLQTGELSGDWAINGSVWRLAPSVNMDIITFGKTGTFLMYGSTLFLEADKNYRFENGTISIINSTIIGKDTGSNIVLFGSSVDSLIINRLYASQLSRFDFNVTPDIFKSFHHHDARTRAIFSTSNVLLDQALFTDASNTDIFASGASAEIRLQDPITGNHSLEIGNAAGIVVEQYTCNIHVTDKDGVDLQSVDVDCEYAHLVEGTDSKTYKCIQDHTAVDATHKPITGSDYASFWELFDAGGGLGGDWTTGFDYKAGAEEFTTQTTDANGDIAEQVVQYHKWTTTSELLEARIHKFVYSHASYPDSIINDIIVDHPLVWEFDMGQSTSDLTAIVQAAAPTVDEIWAKAMVDLAAGAPSVTASAITAMNYIYEAWRNRTVTDTPNNEIIVYKDDGTTKLCESDISDDGTLFTKGKYGTPD